MFKYFLVQLEFFAQDKYLTKLSVEFQRYLNLLMND